MSNENFLKAAQISGEERSAIFQAAQEERQRKIQAAIDNGATVHYITSRLSSNEMETIINIDNNNNAFVDTTNRSDIILYLKRNCKITDIAEDDAPQAGPQAHPGIAPGNAQSLRIPAEDEAGHDDSRHQGTAKSNLQRRQSIRRQLAGKQTDDAPTDTRCDDAKRRHTFYFHLYHLLKKIGLAKDKRLRSSPGFIIAQSQQLMI